MVKWYCLVLGGLLPCVLLAQASGFLYIESSPSKAFYLRTRDSLYSSSPGNYLILAPLQGVAGEIILGFKGSQEATLSFTLKDTLVEQGLLLRDLKGEGWRLFDWRKNEPVTTRRMGRQEAELQGMVKRSDPFAVKLAQVVNDSIILYTTLQPVGTADKKQEQNGMQAERKSAGKAALPVKRLEKKDRGSYWLLIYEIKEAERTDTITLEIDKSRMPSKPAKPGTAAASSNQQTGNPKQ